MSSRLTNVRKVFGFDLFDLVEAGVQVGCLFRHHGNSSHVWSDLLTVHRASETHTQQAGGKVCNTKSTHRPQALSNLTDAGRMGNRSVFLR